MIAFRDQTKGARTCDGEAMRINEAGRVNTQLEAARKSLERAEMALEDLQEEARRGGALPGWLR